eukprot:gene2041-2512_t
MKQAEILQLTKKQEKRYSAYQFLTSSAEIATFEHGTSRIKSLLYEKECDYTFWFPNVRRFEFELSTISKLGENCLNQVVILVNSFNLRTIKMFGYGNWWAGEDEDTFLGNFFKKIGSKLETFIFKYGTTPKAIVHFAGTPTRIKFSEINVNSDQLLSEFKECNIVSILNSKHPDISFVCQHPELESYHTPREINPILQKQLENNQHLKKLKISSISQNFYLRFPPCVEKLSLEFLRHHCHDNIFKFNLAFIESLQRLEIFEYNRFFEFPNLTSKLIEALSKTETKKKVIVPTRVSNFAVVQEVLDSPKIHTILFIVSRHSYFLESNQTWISNLPKSYIYDKINIDDNSLFEEDSLNFVSITSYRDPECQWTIKNIFETSDQPHNLFIGICWQYDLNKDTNLDKHCFEYTIDDNYKQQIRIIEIDYHDAKGPCIARSMAQQLWRGERYFMQIDSHMRFIKSWDTILKNQLKQCPSEKPILTGYPMGYTRPDTLPPPSLRYPLVLVATHFDDQDGMLRFSGRIVAKPQLKPLNSLFWISGFSFSSSTVIQEVPYDIHLDYLFFGEEISMSARLWTNGYDFFSPTKAVVFHLWQRDYRPTFRENTQSSKDEEKLQRLKKEQLSRNRVKYLLGMIKEDEFDGSSKIDDKYGLGTVRTLKQFEEHCGINFKEKQLTDRSKFGGYQESFFMNEIMELVIKSKIGL